MTPITDKKIYQDDDQGYWRVTHKTPQGDYVITECDNQGIILDDPYREELALWEIKELDIIGKVD